MSLPERAALHPHVATNAAANDGQSNGRPHIATERFVHLVRAEVSDLGSVDGDDFVVDLKSRFGATHIAWHFSDVKTTIMVVAPEHGADRSGPLRRAAEWDARKR